MITQEQIYGEIAAERQAQDEQWGRIGHMPGDWILIIGKHFGKLCATDLDMGAAAMPYAGAVEFVKAQQAYRDRLVKVAALCVAALEDFE